MLFNGSINVKYVKYIYTFLHVKIKYYFNCTRKLRHTHFDKIILMLFNGSINVKYVKYIYIFYS